MPEFLNSIIERLNSSAKVQSVFGEPIAANGKTIIPVARVAYGFGGGAGEGAREGKPGKGEGGGGGVVATPLGVFEITDGRTRFVPLGENRKLLAAALAGVCLGLLWAKRTAPRTTIQG